MQLINQYLIYLLHRGFVAVRREIYHLVAELSYTIKLFVFKNTAPMHVLLGFFRCLCVNLVINWDRNSHHGKSNR